MKNINVFKRREVKYLITRKQKKELSKVMEKHMQPDEFGKSTIRNIYYDTPDKLLIRRSIDKPDYKEKLRVRSYEQVKGNSKVFIEVKKKYKGIVYKRRMGLKEETAKAYLNGNLSLLDETQISKEIDYLMDYYEDLEPAIFLAYDREAYFSKTDTSFSMTFDENLIIRDYDISLTSPVYGEKDMLKGKVVLEVKTVLGMPKWLLDFFSENKIYKASFSKYGNAYMKYLLPKDLEKKASKEKLGYKYEKIRRSNLKDRKKIKKTKEAMGIGKFKKAIPFIAGVLLYFLFFANWQYERITPQNKIYVDVNPSINFTTNSREEIIELGAVSNEGRKIINEIEHKGKSVDILTKEILDKMVRDDYISKEKEYLLLSIESKDEKKDIEKNKIKDLIYSYFKTSEIQPIVLKQYINKSSEIEELAKKYSISISKMIFIKNIISLNEELKESELVTLSISELVELIEKNNLNLEEIVLIDDRVNEILIEEKQRLEEKDLIEKKKLIKSSNISEEELKEKNINIKSVSMEELKQIIEEKNLEIQENRDKENLENLEKENKIKKSRDEKLKKSYNEGSYKYRNGDEEDDDDDNDEDDDDEDEDNDDDDDDDDDED